MLLQRPILPHCAPIPNEVPMGDGVCDPNPRSDAWSEISSIIYRRNKRVESFASSESFTFKRNLRPD